MIEDNNKELIDSLLAERYFVKTVLVIANDCLRNYNYINVSENEDKEFLHRASILRFIRNQALHRSVDITLELVKLTGIYCDPII